MAEYSSPDDFIVGVSANLSREITEGDIQRMAEITGDYNPLHMDEDFAKRTRFKGRIAHGVFSVGLISAVLGTKLPGPGSIFLRQTLDFLYPVRAGDVLTAEVEVISWQADKRIIALKTRCLNQDGRVVVSGEAVLLVDKL
jgi:3-hydroxybutyryl-CoA dehydratase